MTKIKVAINGFGRIGRITYRRLLLNKNIEVVAINDLTDAPTLAHLLKYDSNHGRFQGSVSIEEGAFIVDGHRVSLYSERDPQNLPWARHNVDVVVESTGIFRDRESASKHIKAGAKKVIISAPAKGDVHTIVIGVNETTIKPDDTILSNASCTTNCLAPIAKILEDNYGIEHGFINTIHAYTADQRLQDAPHKDLRRARAAASSIIPTSTGAAKAVGLVLPSIKGKLDGLATRVPVPVGSLTDLTVLLTKKVTVEELNKTVKEYAATSMKGIVEYTEDEIVSADIVGNPHSSIFDAKSTAVLGNLVKVIAWYDNEYGYSARTAELVELVMKKG